MKKKTLALVLMLVLALSLMFPASALAAETQLEYDEGTVAVIKYSNGEVKQYTSLKDAINAADVGETVNLVTKYAIDTDLTIPEEVTVTVPSSASLDDTIRGVRNVSGNGSEGDPYVTFTVPAGLTLTVEGTLLVAGNQQGSQPRSGFLTGDYGAVDLEGTILVTGSLYARGKIDGEGKVVAERGGTVYERYEISDWRGGSQSQTAYNGSGEDATDRVFPFNLYELNGISTDLEIKSDASLHGQAFVYVSFFGLSADVPYIGSNTEMGSVVNFAGAGGMVTFTKDEAGKTLITLDGANMETGHLSFNATIGSITYSFDSDGLPCPFGYNINIQIINSGKMTVANLLEVLPGCTVTVDESSTLNIAATGAMYFYAKGTFSENYFYHPYGTTWGYEDAATLTNSGTVTVDGKLGSTDENFSNITGIDHTPNDTVTIYEYQQNVGPQEVEFHVYTPNPTPAPDPDPTPAE